MNSPECVMFPKSVVASRSRSVSACECEMRLNVLAMAHAYENEPLHVPHLRARAPPVASV